MAGSEQLVKRAIDGCGGRMGEREHRRSPRRSRPSTCPRHSIFGSDWPTSARCAASQGLSPYQTLFVERAGGGHDAKAHITGLSPTRPRSRGGTHPGDWHVV